MDMTKNFVLCACTSGDECATNIHFSSEELSVDSDDCSPTPHKEKDVDKMNGVLL